MALKPKRHLPDFAKNILQDPERTRQQAAWELLYAVYDLFPERYAELRSFEDELDSSLDEHIDENGTFVDETPSITAYPHTETRQEFLKGAGQ
jgi:hypothetical protein